MIDKLDTWHKTKKGLLAFACIELVIAYGFISLSIDRGNFIWYLLALLFLIGGLQNFVKFIGTFVRHGKK
jgi:hypothetical protein